MSTPVPASPDERYERLPIDVVFPSKTNPRHHFDDAYLAELAGSIREKGVIQPILVRQTSNGSKPPRFEIVAGECRYRASKLGNETHIPAIIRGYTDEQVLELQLIENIHRQDLTPLEQARGYRALIDQNPTKHSVESIATRIGMSAAWVWDRIKLNDLVPEAKAILERELMTVGHAILIARLKPADQARVIDAEGGRNSYNNRTDGLWESDNARLLDEDDEQAEKKDKYHGLKAVSIRELDSWIQDHIRFDVEHAAKAVPLQFETTAQVVQDAAAQPGRGKKVIAITHEYRVADDARDESERTYGSQSWERADGQEKSKTCELSVLGVVVAGRGQGDTLQVCVNRDKCKVHFAKVIAEREKNQKLRDAGKGKKAAQREASAADKQEARWEIEDRKRKEEQAAWEALKPQALAGLLAHLKAAKLKFTAAFLRLALSSHDISRLEKSYQLKLTDDTALVLLALNSIQTYNRSNFLSDVKRWKFNLGSIEQKVKAAEKKPAADAKAKPATKRKGA